MRPATSALLPTDMMRLRFTWIELSTTAGRMGTKRGFALQGGGLFVRAPADWRTIANGVLEFEIQSYSQADLDATPRPTAAPSWDSEIAGGKTARHVILRLKIVDGTTAVTLSTLAATFTTASLGKKPGNSRQISLCQLVRQRVQRSLNTSGFALIVTLILMVMIVVIVVGYLGITRSDRAATSSYANRLRAKMIAEGGLASATHLLKENTRYGNYITAMPSPSPTSPSKWTEVYRPVEPSPRPANFPPDYLKVDNAIGEMLVSRADTSAVAAPTPQFDPRPSPTPIPAPPPGGNFGIVAPTLTSSDSYDFNQIVRVGNTNGRLVNPDARPAFGQWVRVRNSTGELIGRYAFFIEDESMKVNVNVSGNNLGTPNLRVNDLVPAPSPAPAPTPSPGSQIEEIDPSAVLPLTADRAVADQRLTATGITGQRVVTSATIALLDEWKTNFPDYAHTVTAVSKDDNTTARGWQRLDLNALVSGATDKSAKAHEISDWIQNAWTGPSPLIDLQGYQLFGDERQRLQLAANIIDYIDTDRIPTEVLNDGNFYDPPIIGIEKIPYLTELDAVYTATGTAPGTATVALKFRFKFQNLFNENLTLESSVGKIRVKGAPAVIKNGQVVFDPSIELQNGGWAECLVPGGGLQGSIPWGPDQDGRAGAKTFTSDVVLTKTVNYSTTPPNTVSRFEAGLLEVEVLGRNGERLDITKMALNDREAKYADSTPALTYDFLQQSHQAASINVTYELAPPNTTIQFGDPRYRPLVSTKRWYNITRTDEARVNTFVDQAEQNSRTFAVDWYDYFGDRPFLFHRDGPMLSPGELGNVSVCEYPWRTIYLQQPERPVNTTQVGPATDVPLRRTHTLDYVLLDLFRTSSSPTRSGGININSQQQFGPQTQQNALAPLFFGIPVGTQTLAQAAVDKIIISPGYTAALPLTVSSILNRRIATGPPSDNNPRRPFFQIGELASPLSRLISLSNGTTASSRSQTAYSVVLPANYQRDTQIEQTFRKVSDSITTRGNVFRVLYVGQAIKDINRDGIVQTPEDDPTYVGTSERIAEFLGEAFIERQAIFQPDTSNPTIVRTSDSKYRILNNRVITE